MQKVMTISAFRISLQLDPNLQVVSLLTGMRLKVSNDKQNRLFLCKCVRDISDMDRY